MRRKVLIGASLSLGLLITADQVLQQVILRDGEFMGHPVAPFDPPLFAPSQRERLARIESALSLGDPAPESLRFDSELGWCNPPKGGAGEFRYDWAGARIGVAPLAEEKSPEVRRLAVYGCSMTHGDEVGALETWASQLNQILDGVEVANMGVSAYGLDQALLRMQRDGAALAADEIWLVWMPQATLRITTLYRPFLRHWSLDVAFKPRFVLDQAGALEAVANPARELADIPRLLHDQEMLLGRIGDKDHWVTRAPRAYLPRGASWLHRSGFARLLLTALEGSGRELARHLERGQDTRELLEELVLESDRQAELQGASFRLIILPGPDDLAAADGGEPPWMDVCSTLENAGIEIIDLTNELLGKTEAYAEHGHLNAMGCRIAAEALALQMK